MSHRTLPLLYLNLAGEMMYIIDDRLMHQKILPERAVKVLNDIVSTTFNRKFIHEIFIKHQPIYSKNVLRLMFDRLSNASTMRLYGESFDKKKWLDRIYNSATLNQHVESFHELYELMIMAVKHQFQMIRNPRHLIMVTLNHLDAMQDYATNQMTKKNILVTYELLINAYCNLSVGQLQSVRYALLNFLQDYRIRVSVFLSRGLQYKDSTFKFGPQNQTYKGVDKPGQIIYFDHKGEVMDTSEFQPGITFEDPESDGGLGLHEIGNRGTKYGLNMYTSTENENSQIQGGAAKYVSSVPPPSTYSETTIVPTQEPLMTTARPTLSKTTSASAEDELPQNELATKELNLLAQLIGADILANDRQSRDTFKINLFDQDKTNNLEKPKSTKKKNKKTEESKFENTLEFDLKVSSGSARRPVGDQLNKVINEMTLEDNDSSSKVVEDDLLALMDQLQ